MAVPDLVLDPSLRYWVLLPISFAMVLVGVLRTYITILLEPSPKLQEWKAVREQQHLQHSAIFRKNYFILPSKQDFELRKKHISETMKSMKYLKDGIPDPNELPPNPLSDPNAPNLMFSMIKNNIANYVPQAVIMWWVNYFFAGFVIMKLPFPLTLRFKSMLQNGVSTPDLDVRWVSSISWYFVNLFGLKAVYSLILKSDSALLEQQTQQMPIQMPGANIQVHKVMKGESESVMILQYTSCMDEIEERILKLYA
ncbi:hypothetical protein PACTADRAFT_51144 [Pachysolen tannophilus NRRL Y-2460]|uniref:ER membrane protein complex subunit 3 n=1 Tax=Pachysolen tannophilus NRRL Y-2460 TaxID=669874 RepID=A0A1E4TRB3_PACTA|nr:hypothetical protein PACTADRAFT_51144 [Pachysolen tannophilus NRRL Y-2460]